MKFKFKENAQAEIGSEEPWYALTDGGYLKPEEVLSNQQQIDELKKAISLVKAFIQQCYDSGVLEEC